MADLKEDLAILGSSIGAAVAAFLSWFYQSSLFGTVTGIFIGAGVTYFVQTRTQKRLWRRDYTMKITEQVYGELFGELKHIINQLQIDGLRDILPSGKWKQIQSDHRYFMVDEKFREEIDGFFKDVDKFNIAFNDVVREIIPDIIKKQEITIFNKNFISATQLIFSYSYDGRRTDTGIPLTSDLRELKTLEDIKMSFLGSLEKTRISGTRFIIKATDPVFFTDDFKSISSYWESCLKLLRENDTFASLPSEKTALLNRSEKIKKDIEKRISESWRI
jgi:hypothetical protein